MRLSKFFLPVLKETPQEAQTASHRLMLRSGMIKQTASGIYSWLPLGLKALKNVENIIRKHMNEAEAIELLMPCLQPIDLWIESGREKAYGKEKLEIKDRHSNILVFAPTNEELISDIVRRYIKSYKGLPKNFYHIQWKFRDEIRPRFGVMRGREFLMKDAYSFDFSKEAAKRSYDKMYITYLKIFNEMDLKAIPVITDSGEIGGDLCHEFNVIASTGENTIYYDKEIENLISDPENNFLALRSLYAVSDEKHTNLDHPNLRTGKSIEVGHIFYIGSKKYSEPMNVHVSDDKGNLVPLEMGCYGIGVSRLVGAIIENSHDERGIIWPITIAPFKISLINLFPNDINCTFAAEKIYEILNHNDNVLYDDLDISAGSKFATHDLIGSPLQIIVSKKKIAQNIVEVKTRKTMETVDIQLEEIMNFIEPLYS